MACSMAKVDGQDYQAHSFVVLMPNIKLQGRTHLTLQSVLGVILDSGSPQRLTGIALQFSFVRLNNAMTSRCQRNGAKLR